MEIVIGVLIGISAALILFVVMRGRLLSQFEKSGEISAAAIEQKVSAMLPEILKQSNEMLINTAKEKLATEKQEIKTDVENKRSEIERMVKQIQEELKNSNEKLVQSDKDRIGSFNALREKLEDQHKLTEQLRVTTDALRKVLSNNQTRGEFGEQVAEDLLKMAGFVRGVDYEFNKEQAGSETRPDFIVFLPDKTRINVDSKFPYANLQRMAESENEDEKKGYFKKFEADVKEKIKQVISRDYISPADRTVDFAIIFIPNEMIFSYIYEKLPEIWQFALANKVILAGPFSFTAILRMVKQAYDNFKVQSNIFEIIKHVKEFEKEFEKFYSEFQKIGDKISSLDKQYTMVNSTRVNQLQKRVERVKLQEVVEENPQLPGLNLPTV